MVPSIVFLAFLDLSCLRCLFNFYRRPLLRIFLEVFLVPLFLLWFSGASLSLVRELQRFVDCRCSHVCKVLSCIRCCLDVLIVRLSPYRHFMVCCVLVSPWLLGPRGSHCALPLLWLPGPRHYVSFNHVCELWFFVVFIVP